jgi:predicted membrane-bound spermidine synthase
VTEPTVSAPTSPRIGAPEGGRQLALAVLLLASGFCGISYEVLYGRLIGNLVGEPFGVTAAVLLTFLLGIGLGTWGAHRLWRHLWLVEGAIGVCGIVIAASARWLDGLFYAYGATLIGIVIIASAVLCVPAFLIGCSVPLFAGYMERLADGRPFARVYTIYNVGAAITALLIEFVLVRAFGVRGTVCVIASLNAAVAAGLFFGFRAVRRSPPPRAQRAHFELREQLALAVVSVASAVFQLLMVKLAECFLGPFRETFAVVLAVVLGGIAAGSAIVGRFGFRFGAVAASAAVGVCWALVGYGPVTSLYAQLYPTATATHALAALFKVTTVAVLMGPGAVAFGATVPAMLTRHEHVARDSGRLLGVSSLANAGGFLLMVGFLHRHFEYGPILAIVAAAAAAAALVSVRPLRGTVAAIALGAAASTALACRFLWHEEIAYFGHTAFHSSADLRRATAGWNHAQTFRGYEDTFSITWTRGKPHFYINGYVSMPLDAPHEKLVGAFSSTFSPRLDRALVLGLGSGATGGTVSLLFEHTDAVEINPVVVENLARMAPYNFDVANRPGIRIVKDDAIHFVKSSRETYSLVVNTVTSPIYFSSSKLYTEDFFRLVRDRMTPDGVYMTWLDSRVGDEGADIIFTTINRTFAHCALGLVKSSYYLVLCSDAPITPWQSGAVAGSATLRSYFAQEEIAPEAIRYGLLLNETRALAAGNGSVENVLDHPTLEFAMARLNERGFDRFKERLAGCIDPGALAAAAGPDWDAVAALVHLESLAADSPLVGLYKARLRASLPDFDARYARAAMDRFAALAADATSPEARSRWAHKRSLAERKLVAEKDP